MKEKNKDYYEIFQKFVPGSQEQIEAMLNVQDNNVTPAKDNSEKDDITKRLIFEKLAQKRR